MKHVHPCLSARKSRESSFQPCEARASLFMCGKVVLRPF